MKPQRIELVAFGSYAGKQVVALDRLCEHRFFLVCGPTGAGKTTLFDAICYGLYGETSGGARSGQQMRCDLSSPETLTEVTFDFALGSKVYRVWRSPRQRRAKLRGEGLTRDNANARLWQLRDDGVGEDREELLADGVKSVTERVEQLLGFRADQFRQVVLLPQGRFEKLLTAPPAERQRLLDALFDTAIYGRIEEALKAADKRGELQVQQLRAERKALLEQGSHGSTLDLGAELDGLGATIEDTDQRLKWLELVCQRARAALGAAELLVEAGSELELAQQELRAAGQQIVQVQDEVERQAVRDQQRGMIAEELHRLRDLVQRVEALSVTDRVVQDLERQRARLDDRPGAHQRRIAQLDQSLEQLELSAEQLSRAAAEFGSRQQAWELARKQLDQRALLDDQRSQVDAATARQQAAEQQLTTLETRLVAARDALSSARVLWLTSQATQLAHQLEPGQACPVCGSTDHPRPAAGPGARDPGDGEVHDLDELREKLVELERQREQHRTAHHEQRAAVSGARARAEGLAEVLGALAEQPVDSLSDALVGLESGVRDSENAAEQVQRVHADMAATRAKTDEERRALADLEQKRGDVRHRLVEQRALLEERQGQVPEALRSDGALAQSIAQTEMQQRRLDEQARSLQQIQLEAQTRRAAAEQRVSAAERARERAQRQLQSERQSLLEARDLVALPVDVAEQLRKTDDLALLREHVQRVQSERDAALERKGHLHRQQQQLRERLTAIGAVEQRLVKADTHFGRLRRLHDVASGKTSSKVTFQRYVLAGMLEDVLLAASERLHRMTRGRFTLHRAAEARGGLDLQVADHTTGTLRSPITLSGGETFMASLCLALGLADVVQAHSGGVRLDTVFIDEGFGGLDAEALDQALLALTEIQQAGKQVAIISHVPELRERIPARLEVTAGPSGSEARVVLP